jgi:hypothetical protein
VHNQKTTKKKSDRAAVEQQKYEQGKSAAKRRRAAENNGKKKNPWRGDEDFEPEPTGLTSAQGLRGRDRGGLTGVHNATSGNPIRPARQQRPPRETKSRVTRKSMKNTRESGGEENVS